MYRITQSQWDMIDPICKMVGPGGQPYFRERDLATGSIFLVAVSIEEHPEPGPVPPHYEHVWPLDPRD